jgi:acetyltransferase-like isoleucine patch superfamily enzyme
VKITAVLRVSILRTLYLSMRFHGQVIVLRGTRVQLARGARIELAPGARLTLGNYRFQPTPMSLCIRRNGRLSIDGDVTIFRGVVVLISDDAHLEMGDKSYINRDSKITCLNHISIGSNCAISWNTNILDSNAHELVVAGEARPRKGETRIGDHVWIGTGVTVVGSSIGSGAVVGAGSVVTSDIPAEVLAAGNPARLLRKDVSWRL